MKTGHYLVKDKGRIFVARWDGKQFNSEFGTSTTAEVIPHNLWQRVRKFLGLSVRPIAYSCPSGCTCTENPDGSITVKCKT